MKDRTRRKVKKWIRKNKKYVVLGFACVLVILLVFVSITMYLEADRVGHALKAERFENVQVEITKEWISLEEDEEGNITETEDMETTKLQKDGNTYYEKNDSNEFYQYEKEGKFFLLYHDDFYGIKQENDNWVEVLVAEQDSPISFDFSIFEKLKKSDFQKVNDYYVLTENVAEIFSDIMKIDDDSKFYGYDMKFYFEKGQITKIVISYHYAIETQMIQTFMFSYKETCIEVPKADVEYTDTKKD